MTGFNSIMLKDRYTRKFPAPCQVGYDLDICSIWHMHTGNTVHGALGCLTLAQYLKNETGCTDCFGKVPATESLFVLRGCILRKCLRQEIRSRV